MQAGACPAVAQAGSGGVTVAAALQAELAGRGWGAGSPAGVWGRLPMPFSIPWAWIQAAGVPRYQYQPRRVLTFGLQLSVSIAMQLCKGPAPSLIASSCIQSSC